MSYFDRISIMFNGTVARVNNIYNALTQIGYNEDILHRGYIFRTFFNYDDLSNNSSHILLVRTGANPVQFFTLLNATGEIDLELFEDPTTSADGNALVVENANRDSSVTSSVTVYEGPTVSDEGTVIDMSVSFGGTGNPQATRVGATISPTLGWVLKPNSDYLVKVTNRAGIAADGIIKLSFNCCVVVE